MCEKIFPKPAIEAKHRGGLLGAHFDIFLNWMQKHGYSRETMRYNFQRLTHFGKYLKRRGVRSIHELEGAHGQKLLIDYQRYWKARGHWGRNTGLQLYIRALEEAGVLNSPPPACSTLFHETRQYADFLRNQKGLSENTVNRHIRCVEKFLYFIGSRKNVCSIPIFGITELDRFIEQEGIRLRRNSQQLVAGALRSFVRFLYQSGKISRDLSCLITSPRCYKLESLPRVLSQDEVKKILHSVDMSTKSGTQHYAILALLATYGLRAGEIAKLKLEDIDWRRETIRITQQKTGRNLLLPLVPQVGKAILKYLQHGRPSSKYRKVFLLTCAPRTPLASCNIAYVVNRHIELAGLDPPRRGPHMIRHSFATHLIRKDVSLKEIGDLLGHRSSESTHVYTKTATENLREVALEVPEVK